VLKKPNLTIAKGKEPTIHSQTNRRLKLRLFRNSDLSSQNEKGLDSLGPSISLTLGVFLFYTLPLEKVFKNVKKGSKKSREREFKDLRKFELLTRNPKLFFRIKPPCPRFLGRGTT
jgi:hypothetical protein